MKKLTTILLLLNITIFSTAQDCGCDHTLTQSGIISANDAVFKTKPKGGDVICIKAGNYGYFRLFDFVGTKEAPIIFKNCGGKVVISDDTYTGIQFRKSKYIVIDGSGSNQHEYGIKIAKAKSAGVSISDFSSDAEIHHLEITNTGFACIVAKTDPDCFDESAWRGNFVMENLHFHHNYLHNNNEGEGFYIGYTSNYELGKTVKCQLIDPVTNETTDFEKILFGHLIKNVELDHNKIVNIAWDGLQISQATEGVKVHDNYLENYGILTDRPDQRQGIAIGSGTSGEIYSNLIVGGVSHGISNFGLGPIYIYNNIIINSGERGIYCDQQSSIAPGNGYYIANNTIVRPALNGIFYNNGVNLLTSPFVCYNNLIVDPGIYETELAANYWADPKKQSYIGFKTKESFALAENTLKNNIYLLDVDDVKFVDPDFGSWGLAKGSIAIDSGLTQEVIDVFGYDTDYSGFKRTGNFDVGAFEFGNPVGLPESKKSSDKIYVYPNLVQQNKGFELNLNIIQSGSYQVSLIALSGEENITLFDSVYLKSGSQRLKIDNEIASGMYLLKVVGDGYFEVLKLQIK